MVLCTKGTDDTIKPQTVTTSQFRHYGFVIQRLYQRWGGVNWQYSAKKLISVPGQLTKLVENHTALRNDQLYKCAYHLTAEYKLGISHKQLYSLALLPWTKSSPVGSTRPLLVSHHEGTSINQYKEWASIPHCTTYSQFFTKIFYFRFMAYKWTIIYLTRPALW